MEFIESQWIRIDGFILLAFAFRARYWCRGLAVSHTAAMTEYSNLSYLLST